jgi:3-phenylpropionate/trans-cinnamate dioxygenase ferredoxin reductase subunit
MDYTYVIIGAGIAGERAAEGIRKIDPEGSIVIIGDEAHPPYERPSLSKGYLQGTEGLDRVHIRDSSFFFANRIEIFQGARVQRIDRGNKLVFLEDGRSVRYQKLLLATGGRALRLPLPGADLPGVFVLRTVEDADAIRQAAGPKSRAVVLGGGFIGTEASASLVSLGTRVTVVFTDDYLLKRVAPAEWGKYLGNRFEQQGAEIRPGRRPAGFEGNGRLQRVRLDDGTELPADLALIGVGIRLSTELAREAGLKLSERGEVIVNELLQTSDPDIYAAGDIAAWPDPTSGKRLRVEHWDVARQQGLRAGRNMAGEGKPYATLPYFYSDVFDMNIEAWGDLSPWDRIVPRGQIDLDRYTFFYFRQGRLTGALTVGRIPPGGDPHAGAGELPAEERKGLGALIKAAPTSDAIADRLADETADIAKLAETQILN